MYKFEKIQVENIRYFIWPSKLSKIEINLEQNQDNTVDKILLERFEEEIWNKVPHLENNEEGAKIVNATPLVDITADFKECAKEIYKLDLSNSELQVYGKLDSTLLTGSIKVRPAANIIHDAIMTGKIKSGQTVIEATSVILELL